MQAKIDEETFTIAFERRLAAPREDVFDAWTRPELLAEWWDPTGARLVACDVDLRPGGAFSFVTHGHAPPFTGTYVEIDRPGRLVFDALGSRGTVVLETVGAGTHMRVTIHCATRQHLEHFVQLGVAPNTDRTLDNLVRFVDARARREAS